jgi:hypothetical protein
MGVRRIVGTSLEESPHMLAHVTREWKRGATMKLIAYLRAAARVAPTSRVSADLLFLARLVEIRDE